MTVKDSQKPPVFGTWLRRFEPLLILMLLGLLSFLLHQERMPGLIGLLNDDALYANYAKALLTGQGYVMLNIPTHPPAIRYPILFPAFLTIVMAGARSLHEQINRLQWVPPISASAFVGLCYFYFRKQMRWSLALALLAGLLIALHPELFFLGTNLLSDLPYSVLMLGAIMLIESSLKTPSGRTRWMVAGLLVAAVCLTRYAGAVLLVSVLLILIQQRRLQALRWFIGTFGLIFLPWLLFRYVTHEHYYLTEYQNGVPHDLTSFFHVASFLSSDLLSNSLPGMLVPWVFSSRGIGVLALGTLLSMVILLGTVAWIRRPNPEETPLPGLLIVLTIAASLVWGIGFPKQDDAFLSRMLLTVSPFLLIACMRGFSEIAQTVHLAAPRLIKPIALSLAVVSSGIQLQTVSSALPPTVKELMSQDFFKLFQATRSLTSPEATLLCFYAPMVNFYTDRPCYNISEEMGPTQLAVMLEALKIDYLVAVPHRELTGTRHASVSLGPVLGGKDRTAWLVTSFNRIYPGVLSISYVNQYKTIALFAIDRTRLTRYVAKMR